MNRLEIIGNFHQGITDFFNNMTLEDTLLIHVLIWVTGITVNCIFVWILRPKKDS